MKRKLNDQKYMTSTGNKYRGQVSDLNNFTNNSQLSNTTINYHMEKKRAMIRSNPGRGKR